jgi:hypothetical protein
MSMEVLTHAAGRAPWPAAAGTAALTWQRTDTVGTELVISAPGSEHAEGSAVVAGRVAYACQWRAVLDDGPAVRALTVTCRGAGWCRTVQLDRDADGWTCRTEETGADPSGHCRPAPGMDNPARLAAGAAVVLADAPIFTAWAVRRLGLTADAGPVAAPTIYVLRPSLAVVSATPVYQLIGSRRLRVSGDGPTGVYDLDEDGRITYQKGRTRLVR